MGTWTSLTHQPGFNASTMLLLADGTVMCQDSGSPYWHKLTPDNTGNYIAGTWSALANGPNAPLYYASAVLADGRVFVTGGEYDDGLQLDLAAAQITGSPVFHQGKLYVPVRGNDEVSAVQPTFECCRFRGSLVALVLLCYK
jgi:hypothetical protein